MYRDISKVSQPATYCSFIYVPSQPLVRLKDRHTHTHTVLYTSRQTHMTVVICEGYSCNRMTVFTQGEQADSVTFSFEKMINATIHIRKRKKKKNVLHRFWFRGLGRILQVNTETVWT